MKKYQTNIFKEITSILKLLLLEKYISLELTVEHKVILFCNCTSKTVTFSDHVGTEIFPFIKSKRKLM